MNSPSFDYVAVERSSTDSYDHADSALAMLNIDTPPAAPQTPTNSTTVNCLMAKSAIEPETPSGNDMSIVHIGIGVGAAVAGILLGALISILCLRLRRKRSGVNTKLESNDRPRRPGLRSRHSAPNGYPNNAYGMQEFSPIYPDESASCYYPEASREALRAYATDFAMADRQIWTDHVPSRSPETTNTATGSTESLRNPSSWLGHNKT